MVNSGLIAADDSALRLDPEVALAIAYAPTAARPGLRALWRFDARLANVLRTTREPMVGQMRLTWWHDAVARATPLAGEPVLAELAAARIAPEALQRIVEGWEALLDGDDAAALAGFAGGRGGGLFAAAATLLGPGGDVQDAGAGWALVDLARHHSDPAVAARALALARDHLIAAPLRWPKAARPLGMLAKLARRDLKALEPQGSPRRVAALAMLALTGR